jgi:hypothetical protein
MAEFPLTSLKTTHPSGWRRAVFWFFAGLVLLGITFVGLVFWFVGQVPKSYPSGGLPLPAGRTDLGGGLAGFESPYLGHTGSWDGKGGSLGGGTKESALDIEKAMGLSWTFMPVYWRILEPDHPVDPDLDLPLEWAALDRFIIAAQARGLNILMQAPVVGGNAGGPPEWAGRREKGKSAPLDMEALANFAGKLAKRYSPGGTLARKSGWGDRYGVRAWELDNEPESYRTCWKNQAREYAEFVTLAAAQIRKYDPQAVIVGPGMSAGKEGLAWLGEALNPTTPSTLGASRGAGQGDSIRSVFDVLSFHNYEGLDSAFAGEPRTVAQVANDVRNVFEASLGRTPSTISGTPEEYWHTEGNFDFLGSLSAQRRAAWRFQWFARAFAAGVQKVCVMDASVAEQQAIRAFVRVLPDPFPMVEATREITLHQGRGVAFRHEDVGGPKPGRVWVLWAEPGVGEAIVELPVVHAAVEVVAVDGTVAKLEPQAKRVRLTLSGDRKMAPPLLVVDRPASP